MLDLGVDEPAVPRLQLDVLLAKFPQRVEQSPGIPRPSFDLLDQAGDLLAELIGRRALPLQLVNVYVIGR